MKFHTLLWRARRLLREFGVIVVVGVGLGAVALLALDFLSRPIEASAHGRGLAADVEQPSQTFRNCAAARAAGAAPVYRGDRGYGPHLDADSDGVGCEPYPHH